MQFRILGPLEVENDNGPVVLRGAKQRALLASLLLRANHTVSRDRLIDELWGERVPETAAHRLEQHVSQLRKVLHGNGETPVVTRPGGYLLRVPDEALDVAQFVRLVTEGREALREDRPEVAAVLLREALALWRGRPGEDVPFEGIAWPEVGQLEERRAVAYEQLFDAELARGRHAEIVDELEGLVRDEPLRERFRLQLMLALYRSGRQADALAAYQDARRTLAAELGIEPGHALRELEQAILRQDPALELFSPDERPLPPLPRAPAGNLPRPATSLVGREREIGEILALLARGSRFVALTGPGGSGKTRLALEAAYRAAADFPDGVFWVALAPLRDHERVLDTMAQALGAKDGLAAHVGDRRVLVLVDNFEHVSDAGPELASLVAACPELHVLVTSRELLRVSAETEYEVPPLTDSEAIELFCVRGRAQPDETVAELCRRLDNLPLAIEFAAARTTVLSPRQILERISQRLDLLRGARDAESRQRTLRTTIEWSYDLLSAEEQRLFARLAVFAGGCTLEAAEKIAEANLDALQSLVEKSLVQHADERFSMLETILEFAREQLERSGEAERLRRRHAALFLALAHEAEKHLLADEQQSLWLNRLEPDYHNMISALVWSRTTGRPALELRFAAALGQFWLLRGLLQEGHVWLREALASYRGGATPVRARALESAAKLASWQGDYASARELAEQAIAIYRRRGDAAGLCGLLCFLMVMAGFEGDDERLRALSEEQVALRDRLGDALERLNARRIHNLGVLALTRGDYAEARRKIEAELELTRANNWEAMTANALCDLGTIAEAQGRYDEAQEVLGDALRRCVELGWPPQIRQCFGSFAAVAAATGDLERAACLVGAAEMVASRTLEADEPYGVEVLARIERQLSSGLSEAGRAMLLERGRSMPLEEAVEYALAPGRRPRRVPLYVLQEDAAGPS